MIHDYECLACLTHFSSAFHPLICDSCGRENTVVIREVVEDTELDSAYSLGQTQKLAVRAIDLEAEEIPKVPTGQTEVDSLLHGGFVLPATVTVYGRAGTGKSRSSLRWATHIGTTLLVSLEMPLRLALHSATEARAKVENLFMIDDAEHMISEAERIGAECIIFDSYSYSNAKASVLRDLQAWSKECAGLVFLIVHENKKARVSGTTLTEHWPDYVIQFKAHGTGTQEARVIVQKSRYSPTGACVLTI